MIVDARLPQSAPSDSTAALAGELGVGFGILAAEAPPRTATGACWRAWRCLGSDRGHTRKAARWFEPLAAAERHCLIRP
ncbi:MAG: hypothetical protein IPH41_08420 [Sulfuritalea sp.]|nr:hypothetical protein [Sulfuritalea sp.]